MSGLISIFFGLLILCLAVDMMFGGKTGLAGGMLNLLTQAIFQIFQAIIQVVMQLINMLLPVCLQFLGKGFQGLGWVSHQLLKSGTALVWQQDILILGPGEYLQPGVKYRELFDYSQTANKSEVSQLAVGNPQQGDFWLGKSVNLQGNQGKKSGDIWLPNSFLYQHLLLVGATGSGKTELLLQSAENLMCQGNLIAIDAAGFLTDRLSQMALAAGSKFGCWDLSNRNHRVVWNFLEELEKFGNEKVLRAIAEAIYGKIDDNDQNKQFWARDIKWLTAILGMAVAARKQKLASLDPSDLPNLVADRDGVKALLHHLPQANAQWSSDLYDYLTLPDDRFGLDIGFLQTKLSPFKDPDVRAICDGSSGVFLSPALNGKQRQALVIGQSLADGKFGSALAGVMVRYILNVMYRRMKNPQHSWTPAYIICDEAPRLQNIDFEEATAIGRNAKVGVVLICQSLGQFPEKTFPALNNCRTQVFLQGVSRKTADWMSNQLGEYQRQEIQLNVGGGTVGGTPWTQRNVTYKSVPVLGVKELTNRPFSRLPSKRSAVVRVTASDSPMTKPFLTDYSTD